MGGETGDRTAVSIVTALATLAPYGLVYFGATYLMGVGSIRDFLRRRVGTNL